jgi:glycosyltransferase involved in cell wall biosynthesis
MGEDRKDTGMMLKVFLETFKGMENKPALIMKTSGAGFSVIDRKDILDKISMITKTIQGDLPDVYLLHGDLTDEEMNQMYNHPKVKAHLSFTHGEGFGRPLLEASFSGKPIIAPISTGQADFLDKNYTIELPHILTKVPTGAFPKDFHNAEAQWSTVNYGMAGKIMRQVFENYSKFELKGKKQMIVNRQLFTHEKMSEKLISIVDNMLESVPQPVKLKIPSLTKEPTKLKLPTLKKG